MKKVDDLASVDGVIELRRCCGVMLGCVELTEENSKNSATKCKEFTIGRLGQVQLACDPKV